MLAVIRARKHYVNIVNIVLFQAGWLICVLSAAQHWFAISVLSCAAIIGLHLTLVDNVKAELKLIAIAGGIGLGIDSLHILLGVFQTASGSGKYLAPMYLAPMWLVALWMLFATSLRHSLGWLVGKPWLSALSGAIFAPLAYFAGSKFGAIHFPPNGLWQSLAAIALAWALVTPLLFRLAKRS